MRQRTTRQPMPVRVAPNRSQQLRDTAAAVPAKTRLLTRWLARAHKPATPRRSLAVRAALAATTRKKKQVEAVAVAAAARSPSPSAGRAALAELVRVELVRAAAEVRAVVRRNRC